jgi:hypothetical protein
MFPCVCTERALPPSWRNEQLSVVSTWGGNVSSQTMTVVLGKRSQSRRCDPAGIKIVKVSGVTADQGTGIRASGPIGSCLQRWSGQSPGATLRQASRRVMAMR